jgi:hypothetical protein
MGESNNALASVSLTVEPKSHRVKILFSYKTQQIPVGKDLTIYGTPGGVINSANVAHCPGPVIVNSTMRYPRATSEDK